MTTSNITANHPITSSMEVMSKLQGVSNPEVLEALQQVATAVKQVQSIISAGNLNGNLSPNVNNASDKCSKCHLDWKCECKSCFSCF
ncbi:MAG: hypothetical protein IPP71_20070 [Bacteroidetes bacterium]|nr:hypothetical protein [Bacteroidota bacterium]